VLGRFAACKAAMVDGNSFMQALVAHPTTQDWH